MLGGFCVLHQSPTRMTMSNGKVEVLYCVVSGHNLEYRYTWKNALGLVGINSPVLYAFEPGTYRCTVTRGHDGDTVNSQPILVMEGLHCTNVCEL